MKDKKLFKKWWFWVIVVVVLGGIGSLGQSGDNNTPENTNSSQEATNSTVATLPQLNAEEYEGKEGLVVYKELTGKSYKVDATFENPALTDINGKASDVFEPLDPNKTEDRQSVDAFIVGNLEQDGDSVRLSIVHSPN